MEPVRTFFKYHKGPCKRKQPCWPTTRNIIGPNMFHPVVDRRIYTRIFQFPLRINVKISEHAPNFNVFKPRLVCGRILILPSDSSGKKIQIFQHLTDTANLVIGLKFRKNLKFYVLKKFYKNYLNFFVL